MRKMFVAVVTLFSLSIATPALANEANWPGGQPSEGYSISSITGNAKVGWQVWRNGERAETYEPARVERDECRIYFYTNKTRRMACLAMVNTDHRWLRATKAALNNA